MLGGNGRLHHGESPEAIDIGVKLAGALAIAHAQGVLHRDVKPENVLLSSYGEPQLGKRDLFPSLNSPGTRHHSSDAHSDQRQFLKRSMKILNYSDGQNSMIDIAGRCGCAVGELEPVIEKLEQVGLLAIEHAPESISRSNR